MHRCLQLAKNGLRNTAPNPSVGAVLVHQDKIIGEGYTAAYGGAHAEVNCLHSVAEKNKSYIADATLYVSLEPCSHQGKTPACSLLIIEKKIKKVVIGALDPNPIVAGNGIKMLQAHNIEVIENVLEKECQEINKHFFTFHTKGRPYIYLKWAETKNAVFAPSNLEKQWISNAYSVQFVHKMRTETMSILVGKNTVIADNPSLTAREYYGKNPIRFVIDSHLNLQENYTLFDGEIKTVVFNTIQNKELNGIFYVQYSEVDNLIHQIMTYCFNHNINSVLIEGGAHVLQQFIDMQLWDETFKIVGNQTINNGKKAPLLTHFHLEQTFSFKNDTIFHFINHQNK